VIFKLASAEGDKRNPQYTRRYTQRCSLCGGKSYSKYCKLCEYTLFQIDHIIELYLQGTPPENMDNAIAEFDRIYYGNMRLRVFYNSACEVVHYVIDSPDSSFELVEPNFSTIPTPKVISILEESGIVILKEEKLYAGELLQKLARLRLSGYSLSSEEFLKQLRIVYAILTLRITKTLLQHEEFIPQVVTGIFRAISAHIVMHMDSKTVPRQISQSSWRSGFKGINSREVYHMEWDLLGLTPNTSPRIFSDYNPNKEQFISKECMIYYYEYMRDRIRERDRERQR
jgi:hypothetical protein